nr:MAG TPA: endonuclease [Caudoviricetes sp.]
MSDCMPYMGFRNRDGYGQVCINRKVVGAHRVAYCKANGLSLDDIKGMVVRHKCDNPPCCNPEHLEIGTQRDNILDCIKRGRFKSNAGENNPRAKINKTIADKIRLEYEGGGISMKKLANKYNVGKSTIKRVVDRSIWND